MARTMAATAMPVYLSKLRSIDEMREESGRYYHAINQGFFPRDEAEMRTLLDHPDFKGHIGGFVFRLTLDTAPTDAIAAASAMADDFGVAASVHLRMMGANPADETADDLGTANRLTETMLTARAYPDVHVFADTFADNDRGYFVRNGVLDRLFNPRLGAQVVRHVNAALATVQGEVGIIITNDVPGGRQITAEIGGRKVIALLPDGTAAMDAPEAAAADRLINLASGVIATAGGQVNIDGNAPMLLIVG